MTWRDEIEGYENYLRVKGTTETHIKTTRTYYRALGEAYEPDSFLDLSQTDLIDWFKSLKEKGVRETSLKTIASFIKALFRQLNGGETPASLRGMSIGKSRTRVRSKAELVQPEEMEIFLAALDTQKRAIFRLLYASGARPSEILRLKREDVHLTTYKGLEIVELSIKDSKTGEPRTVPLRDSKTLQALKDYLTIAPTDGWLFPTPRKTGGPLTPQALWACMKRTTEKLGIKKRMYPYLLRHTRATELAKAPRAIADKLMGWKSGVMWKNYTHLATDDLRDYIFETEGPPVDVAVQLKTVIETLMSALEEQAEKDPKVLVSVMEKLRDLSIQG